MVKNDQKTEFYGNGSKMTQNDQNDQNTAQNDSRCYGNHSVVTTNTF